MKEIIRNLTRRKLRSILTISGIVIGILALTTMGALANNFNALLDGGVKYYAAYVPVADANSNGVTGGGVLALSKQPELEAVPGVAHVFPSVSVAAKPGALQVVSFGVPDFISSYDPAEDQYAGLKTTFASGGNVTQSGQIILGSTFAKEFGKRVGDTIVLPVKPSDAPANFVQHTYTVVGLLNQTLTAPDTGAYLDLADAQQLFKEQLADALQANFDATRYVTGFDVYGTPGTNLDQLADRVNASVSGVTAVRPSDFVRSYDQGARFNAIALGAALLALAFGAHFLVNAMQTSVTEDTRHLGLKVAFGARPWHIAGERLIAATGLALAGGAAGVVLGTGLSAILDLTGRSIGMDLFWVTGRLLALTLGLAVALGLGAGLAPALRAARLDPNQALRAV